MPRLGRKKRVFGVIRESGHVSRNGIVDNRFEGCNRSSWLRQQVDCLRIVIGPRWGGHDVVGQCGVKLTQALEARYGRDVSARHEAFEVHQRSALVEPFDPLERDGL